ncbi:MAG: hypothetical protein WD716_09620 [Fimbriimonadaceae bacterium]
MATKQQLIRAIQDEPKVCDITIEVGGKRLTVPGAVGIVQRGDAAYLVSYLKPEDIVSVDKSGKLSSKRGQITPKTWEAFVPPPKQLTEAKQKLKGISVPKGFQWAIVGGEPTLVPTTARARSGSRTRTNMGPNKKKYPVGTVVKQKNKANKTLGTGKVVGYTADAYKVEIGGKTVEVKQFGRYWSVG